MAVEVQGYLGNLSRLLANESNLLAMIDRRKDQTTRKRVSEMSREEMRRLLLVSEKTGLPNRRAFEEKDPSPFIAMLDVDGLKMLNDKYGYAAGDVLIRRAAETLVEAGLDAYHDKGDEFICRGESFQNLKRKLAKAHALLAASPFVVQGMDDMIRSIAGATFCFGIGTTLKEAETSLKHQKELSHKHRESIGLNDEPPNGRLLDRKY